MIDLHDCANTLHLQMALIQAYKNHITAGLQPWPRDCILTINVNSAKSRNLIQLEISLPSGNGQGLTITTLSHSNRLDVTMCVRELRKLKGQTASPTHLSPTTLYLYNHLPTACFIFSSYPIFEFTSWCH